MEKSNLAVLVGRNIAMHRNKVRLTQKELAKRLNITENAIIRMEKGIIAPKLSRLQQIADGLDCSVSDLFLVSSQQMDSSTKEKIDAIASLMQDLSPAMQQIILELVEKTTAVLKQSKS